MTLGVRSHWLGYSNASNGRKRRERKITYTNAKKHQWKDERLHRGVLVAHDPVHVVGLRQRCESHNLGQLWIHSGTRKAVYS